MMGIVGPIAKLALEAPRPHLEPGAAADIEAVVEALDRLRVLSCERSDPLGMAVICDGLQMCPAALRADIETARQQLRPGRNGEGRENPHRRYCNELDALSHNASPSVGTLTQNSSVTLQTLTWSQPPVSW